MHGTRVLIVRSLCAIAIVFSVATVRADSTADEADVRFERGNTLYRAGRLPEALAEYFTSNRLAPNRNVVFNIARTYEAMRRFEEAYRYYAEYISLETDSSEKAIAEQKLGAIAPEVALVKIDSTPLGATVYLDRKNLGTRGQTPIVLAATEGKHTIILEHPGYEPATVEVEMTRGGSVTVSPSLALIVGTVQVASTPSAAVYVDRAQGIQSAAAATETPATLSLTPGRHTLEFERAGFRNGRTDVVVTANAETKVEVKLEAHAADSGTVVVAANVQGALVVVGGAERGFTPAVLTLPTGVHALEVRADGYTSWNKQVRVEKDGRAFFQIDLEEAEAEVTGATKTQQTVSSAPASISLVPREEIWAFGYSTLTEALRGVRGYYTTDDLNYESLGVRGVSRLGDYTNRILITRDGHAINDNWIGSTGVARDFATDLDDVERIEVIRGPGSTFYGAGAVFGVLNIVTQAPSRGAPVRAGGRLDSEGGGSAYARGQQQVGPAQVAVKASAWHTYGSDYVFPEFAETPSMGVSPGNDRENSQQAALRVALGDFSLDGAFTRRRKDIPTASFDTVFDPRGNEATDGVPTRTTDRRGYLDGRYERSFGTTKLSARLAYDHQSYEGVWPYDDGVDAFVFGDEAEGNWVTGEARIAMSLPHQRLTLGTEVVRHRVMQGFDDENDGELEFDDRHLFYALSAYLSDDISLSERATISLGARFDRFGKQQDSAISPRVGVVARPYENGRTKFIVGRAFRSPSIYELFYNDGGITQVSPDSLTPETIWTAEVEHSHEFARRTYLTLTGFGSEIDGLINLVEDDEGIVMFSNASEVARSYGGEAELRYTLKSRAWVAAAGSFTELDTEDSDLRVNSSAFVGALRGYWPASGDRFAVASEIVINSGRPRRDGKTTGTAVLGSLFASGKIGTKGLNYRAGVTNLFDRRWSTPGGGDLLQQVVPQDPRTFVIELVWEQN